MNVIIFFALLATTAGLAFRFGGAPERWVAGMFVGAAAATLLLYETPATRFYTVEEGVALVDAALLAGLVTVMLKADRFWPIAAVATHGVTVLSHLVKAIDVSIIRRAYLISTAAPGYVALLILIAAVLRHRRRQLATGDDPDWNIAGRSAAP